MQLMQWQEHTKWSSSSNPNPTKATNAWEGFERKNKRETPRNSKDLDPKVSLHLEEVWLGGSVDLDLLSLFPLLGGKNHGGIERRQALKMSTMEERESAKSWKELGNHWGRKPLK